MKKIIWFGGMIGWILVTYFFAWLTWIAPVGVRTFSMFELVGFIFTIFIMIVGVFVLFLTGDEVWSVEA